MLTNAKFVNYNKFFTVFCYSDPFDNTSLDETVVCFMQLLQF